MVTALAKIFLKDVKMNDSQGRKAYGTLCSVVGIFLNICLFVGKYFAGVLTGAISITADAFNNLSDAGSSIITLEAFGLQERNLIQSIRLDMGDLNMYQEWQFPV